ncbi:MAG TPA: TetR/AcrR family transcriptional regulator [Aliidongia sp.]|uniref:TetR/AcrR family transcriptional regulator n=1 Tax=Aliidongia sp. TaxID=1914230 RepID=UPI002DDCC5E5|nr:TetR/AcrR family transcriptional regulator [Aliidongia sp.]HEV2677239.1 TetR/AcrR family transcriptional regulator [Aliidongia sp.]
MTPEKPDRRTERTRQALLTAFRELVLEQAYDSLGVGDIVARANVGRSTFYDHYDGKDDLLAESIAGPFRTLAALVGAPEMPAALVGTIAHFRENQRVSRTLLTGPTRPILTRSLAELIEARLRDVGRKSSASALIPDALAALYLAAGQLTLVEHWLTAQHSCRPEIIAEALFVSANAAAAALYRQWNVMPSSAAPAGAFHAGTPD